MSRVGVRSLSPSCTTPAPDLRSLVTSFGAVADLVKGMAGAVGPMLAGLKMPGMPGMPSAAGVISTWASSRNASSIGVLLDRVLPLLLVRSVGRTRQPPRVVASGARSRQ